MAYSVCVIGLGTVGFPTAKYFLELGCEVFGYDIRKEAVTKARSWFQATTEPSGIPSNTDVFVVCVSTKLSGDRPDASYVYDACRIVSGFDPKLVSIESTVPVGTCRDIHRTVFDKRTNLAHVPHRYWPEDPRNHGVKQVRVVGSVDAESMVQASEFYRHLSIPLIQVEPIEIAEMSKIAENAHRYVQIALAEELDQICSRSGLDFNLLRNACNSKWNVDIPEARDGIGGTCLPKDICYVIAAAQERNLEPDLLLSAIQADHKYVKQLARSLVYV